MFKKIAIIGQSFEFPSINNTDDLWAGLVNKRCFFHNASTLGDEHIDAWGSVENLKGFDYHFFGYSYNEAIKMDPQHRHLLQHCWWAMESAGYMNREMLPITAVFTSSSENHYLMQNLAGELIAGSENEALLGNLPDFLATRIAWKLGTTGQAFSVQCGCSSGLAALHQARIALLTGQAEMALVGAVSLAAPHQEGYDYLAGGIRSADGKVRVFDRDASGTVFTNGVAAIVLKPLNKALEDGDSILGVIESSALNNDGADKASFTAPAVSGQRRVIQRAMKMSNISPKDIALYEAHGTGTKLGDPVEFAALREAWPTEAIEEPTCALQSVKANVGHLDTVSGLAGIIKACLVLKHRQLPPQLNFENLNPHITLDGSPFFINNEPRLLSDNARYACVSALGIGGTNAHVIMSGAPVLAESQATSPSPHLFLLSAPSQNALNRVRHSWIEWPGNSNNDLEKAAKITQVGRTAFSVRQSVVAYNIEDLKAGLKNSASGTNIPETVPSIVLMFTGQGSQYEGMGKHLYDNSAYFREKLDEKFSVLQELSGKNYRAILFDLQDEIHLPEHTQPALLALEVCLAEYLIYCGIKADMMLGHSLGEYSAMVAAGAINFKDAARLIIVRAKLVQRTAPGIMCSVMADSEMLASLLQGTEVDIAAINSDSLSVVSGTENEISRVIARAQQENIFCQPLKVKRAFHSRILEPILPEFREALKGISFEHPKISIISTLTGKTEPFEIICQEDYWVRQMREPVAFAKAIRKASTAKDEVIFIEVGPGNTLKTLASQSTNQLCINILPHPSESAHAEKILITAYGRLWEQNINIQWDKINDRKPAKAKSVLPVYPFELKDCWTEKKHSDILTLNSYQPCWVPLTQSESVTESVDEWLLITDGSSATADMADILCSQLNHQGAKTRTFLFEGETCEQMMIDSPRNILLLLHPDSFHQKAFKPLLVLLDIVRNWRVQGERTFRIITRSAVDFMASSCPALAALTSAVKSLNQEYPALKTRLIDTDGLNDTALVNEITTNGPVVVALRDSDRFGEGFIRSPHISSGNETISPRSIVILGGGGQVGLQYAQTFLENSQANVRLIQRSSLKSLKERSIKSDSQRAKRIEALIHRWPGRITLGEADVQSYPSLLSACKKAKDDMGSLDILIHTAGIDASMHYQLIRDVDAPFCEKSFAAKSQGLQNMAEVALAFEIPHCHVISSISSALGGIGMYIYGSLHAWLDCAVAKLRRNHSSHWTLINWEAWEFGNDEEVPDNFRQGAFGSELNRYAMQPIKARQFLWQSWKDLNGQRIISSIDFQQRYQDWVENQQKFASPIGTSFPQKAPRPDMKSEYKPPQNTAEERIVTIWESLLGMDGIGIDDNFFELGGHSLLALRMTGQVNQSVNASMSMVDIFQYPTIRKLAASINSSKSFDTARTDAAQRAQRRRQSRKLA